MIVMNDKKNASVESEEIVASEEIAAKDEKDIAQDSESNDVQTTESKSADDKKSARNKKSGRKSSKNKVRFYKKPGFRFSLLASVLSIVFVALIVIVNILATMLDSRINALQLDMTSNNDYTLTEENVGYIKKVDKPVTVTVVGTESYYINSYGYDLQNSLYSDTSSGKYFNQTVNLLKKYPKVNDNITVKFVDPQTPEFTDMREKYGDQEYGSFIVESQFKDEKGTQRSKHKILTIEDIYQVQSSTDSQSSYSYGQMDIVGSKLEQSLTSALYYVTAEDNYTAAILTGYNGDDASNIKTLLEDENYDVQEISSLLEQDIPENVNLLILNAPTYDLTPAEIKKLDEYMSNGKNLGKNIVYLASSAQYKLPNLDSFLEEWGLKFESGTVYETNDNYHASNDNSWAILQDAGSDLLSGMGDVYYAAKNMRPMTLKFEQSDKYQTYSLIKTQDSATIMPQGAKSDWKPADNAVKQEFVSMALCTQSGKNSDDEMVTSNILAISSSDFINYNSYSSRVYGNHEAFMKIINNIVGVEDTTMSVQPKSIKNATFVPTETQANVIKYIVVGIVPIITLAVGIVVVIRRKRK